MPVRGQIFYKLHNNYLPVAPPKVEKKNGKPQTKKRGENEPRPSISRTKLIIKGKQQACSICNQMGHNKASCKMVIEAQFVLELYSIMLFTCFDK